MSRSKRATGLLWRAGVALAAVGLLAAAKMKPVDLEQISVWFAGAYDVTVAVPTVERHEILIERVSSPMISWHVFYAEERDAGGALLAQQLVSFEIAGDRKSIVESSFLFKEPRRWQNGLERADIFKAIIADDLIPASGCQIFWIREGSAFVSRNSQAPCRAARLTASELVYGERAWRKRVAADSH